MEYKPILTIAESEKATVEMASMKGHSGPVVIKRLREANPDIYRLLCHAQNPHVPKIYEVEVQGTDVLVAEEYVDGVNLEEYLAKQTLSDDAMLRLALQLCEAVEFLHTMEPPIIHRDIKPSNILITGKGVLKLIDFDASRNYKENQSSGDTRLLGTVEYAPPEQFGYSQTDVRSDIYSMGVVFHEMTLREDEKRIEEWKRLVKKCTSFDPEHRFQNVAELKKEIKKLIAWKKERRKKLAVLLAFFALVILAAGASAFAAGTAVTQKDMQNDIQGGSQDETVDDILHPVSTDYHFYKSLAENTEVVFRNDVNIAGKELSGGSVYQYATEKCINLPVDMLECGSNYVWVSNEFVSNLEPGTYEIEICFTDTVDSSETLWSEVLEVHDQEEEVPKKQDNILLMGTEEFYFGYPQDVTAILNSTAFGRITALYFRFRNNAGGAELERLQAWCYEIVCDGKAIIVTKEYLEDLKKDIGQINLVVACDDGSLQDIQIIMLSGMPEGAVFIAKEEELPLIIPESREELYPKLELAPQFIWYSFYKSCEEELIIPTGKYSEYEILDRASCYCYQTGLVTEIPKEMIWQENDLAMVSTQFIMSLEPYIYEFTFYYAGLLGGSTEVKRTVKIYQEGATVPSTGSELLKGEQTVYSEMSEVITNVARHGDDSRIIGSYIVNQGEERIEFNTLIRYGTVLWVPVSSLEPYFNQGLVTLYIMLDSGETYAMRIIRRNGKPDLEEYREDYMVAMEKTVQYFKAISLKPALLFGNQEEQPKLDYVLCHDYITEETWKIPAEMTETGPGYVAVSGEYMHTLEEKVYKISFVSSGIYTDLNVQIYPETLTPEPEPLGNYFFGKQVLQKLGVPAQLRYNCNFRITGVSIIRDGKEVPIEPEWCVIACDGRYILVRREFFMQFTDEDSVTLVYHFDDGNYEQVEIALKNQ